MFDYRKMCADVAAQLWALYHGRPDAPHLILPRKRDLALRVSEQESKILITQWLERSGVNYSIETPTEKQYQQSGQAQMSGRIDVTAYGSRKASDRVMNVELKAGTASIEAFRKDFEKLLREGIPGLWFHTLETANEATWASLQDSMQEALSRVAAHADHARHRVWFAFCVLDEPRLVQFELDFDGTWRDRLPRLLSLARTNATTAPFATGSAQRALAAHRGLPVTSKSQRSYGATRKLLVFAPSIDPHTFLHLSIKGESYALRRFGERGPAERFTIPGVTTTSELERAHRFMRSVDVAAERESLESQPDYWRKRISDLNRKHGIQR